MPIRQGTYITIDRYGREHVGHLEEMFPKAYREPSEEEVAEVVAERGSKAVKKLSFADMMSLNAKKSE